MVVDLLTGTLHSDSSLVKLAARRGPQFVAVAVKILGEVNILHGSEDLIKDSFSDDYTVSLNILCTLLHVRIPYVHDLLCIHMGTIASNHEQSCTSWIFHCILKYLDLL